MSSVLDQNLLEELKMVMEEEFPNLMQTFLQESERQYQAAVQAWSERDMETLRRNAHSLKGSCANVGAADLQSSCAKLESFAKDNVEDGVSDLLNAIQQQLREVNSEIRAL